MSVATPLSEAPCNTGPLAKPPVPITTSGQVVLLVVLYCRWLQ